MGKKIIPNVITANNKKSHDELEEYYQRNGDFPVEGTSNKIPITDIRNLYLTNDKLTLEAISDKYGISLRDLRVVANSENWSGNRENIHRRTRTQVQKTMTTQLKELLDVNLDIQRLKSIQLMQTVEYIQQHLSVYGDLWLRDPDVPGQILKDSNGLPRKLPIPREMHDMQELVKLTQGLNSLIGERDEGNETPLLDGKGDSVEPDFREVFGSTEEKKKK